MISTNYECSEHMEDDDLMTFQPQNSVSTLPVL